MARELKCKIVEVGKRRDGGTRFWCLTHRADATAKYGVQAEKCRYSDLPELLPNEILEVDVADHPAGVTLRGALAPVYDTTCLPLNKGLLLQTAEHADRNEETAAYKRVSLVDRRRPGVAVVISELDAIYYFVSSVFDLRMKRVVCTLCGYDHLDKDWFSLHSHQRHLCSGCGRYFRDTEPGVGNPIVGAQELFGTVSLPAKKAIRTIKLKQSDFAGGIQISESSLSVLSSGSDTGYNGINVRAFDNGDGVPTIDETYAEVTIDSVRFDSMMVQVLTAQYSLPHVHGRVISISCPECDGPYFSIGSDAFTARSSHTCRKCGCEFHSRGRQKKIIPNPMIDILKQIGKTAVRPPRKHPVNLLPETL